MSSYGLAGFTQGLARSPLGNLSGLMIQKENLQRHRKRAEQEETDRAFKEETLGLAQSFIEQGDWDSASKLALSRGDHDLATTFQSKINLGEDRRQFDERQGLASAQFSEQQDQFDETQGLRERTLDEQTNQFNKKFQITQDQNKRQEETHALTTAGTERNLNIKSKHDFGSELLNVTGGNFQELLSNPNSLAHVNRIIEKNPKMVQDWLDLPDGRVPIGLSIVTPEGGGEPQVTIDIYNKSSKSVGPATKNASNDPNDEVISMELSRFQGMMEKWAGVSREPTEGKFSIKELGDGTIIKINEKTGETSDVSKTEQQQIRYKREKINEDLKTLTASPGFMAAMPEGTHEFLRFAQYFSEKAIADGADVDGIVGLMGQLWQRRDSIPEIKAYQEASTFDELDEAGGAILARLTGKGGSAPTGGAPEQPVIQQVGAPAQDEGIAAVDPRSEMPMRSAGVPSINLGGGPSGAPNGAMLAEDMSGKAFDVSQDNPAWYAQQNAEKGLAGAMPQAVPEVQQVQAPIPSLGQTPATGYEQSTRQMMKDHLARTYGETAKEPPAEQEYPSWYLQDKTEQGNTGLASVLQTPEPAGQSDASVAKEKRRTESQKRSAELEKSIQQLEANISDTRATLSDSENTAATNYKESEVQIAKRREALQNNIKKLEAEIAMKKKKRKENLEAEIERINNEISGIRANRTPGLADVGAS